MRKLGMVVAGIVMVVVTGSLNMPVATVKAGMSWDPLKWKCLLNPEAPGCKKDIS